MRSDTMLLARRARRARMARASGPGVLNAGKTAKAPMLVAETWSPDALNRGVGMYKPVYVVARSAAAHPPCLGTGSTTKRPGYRVHRTPLPPQLGPAVLAARGRLSRPVGLMRSPS